MRSPRHPSHNKGAYFYGERGEGLKGRGRGVLIIIFKPTSTKPLAEKLG